MSKHKNTEYEAFVFRSDYSIDILKQKDFDTYDFRFAQYVLIPEREGPNYIVFEPNKYLDLKSVIVSYRMHASFFSIFEDDGFGTVFDTSDYSTDGHSCISYKYDNPFSFFQAICEFLKILLPLVTFAECSQEFWSLMIFELHIDAELKNGKQKSFHWCINPDITLASNSFNLRKHLIKEFHIPDKTKGGEFHSLIFDISDNQWCPISMDNASISSLIGLYFNISSLLQFVNYKDIMNIVNNRNDLMKSKIYFHSFDNDELALSPSFYHALEMLPYVSNFNSNIEDFDGFIPPIITIDSLNFIEINDYLAFIMNIHYFLRYISYVAAESYRLKPEDVTSVISFEFTDNQLYVLYGDNYLPTIEDFNKRR